jgi:CHASE1-domain containing sensor protein
MRKTTINEARDKNVVVASGKITLITTKQPGFLIMAPIYDNQKPHDNLTNRQANFKGIIVEKFEINDFFSNILKNLTAENDLIIEIFDKNNNKDLSDENLFYKANIGEKANNTYTKFSLTKQVKVAERLWTIRLTSLNDYATDYLSDKMPLFVLLAGMDITLLTFLVVHMIVKSNEKSLNLAKRMVEKYREHDKLHSHTRVEPFVTPKIKS